MKSKHKKLIQGRWWKIKNNINDLVVKLAKNSSDAHGYVCSGNEALALRKIIGKDKIIFCPPSSTYQHTWFF